MAEKFIFWKSYRDSIAYLPDEDRLALYDAITGYAFDGERPNLTGAAAAVFFAMKPNIDNSLKSIENGSKGGRPKKEKRGVSETEKGGFQKPKTNSNSNSNSKVITFNKVITVTPQDDAAAAEAAPPCDEGAPAPKCPDCGSVLVFDHGLKCPKCSNARRMA